MWKSIVGYGALLALGTLALQWLDYQRLLRTHSDEAIFGAVALLFLVLGVMLGTRVFARPPPPPFDGNPQAVASLGLSAREMEVLYELAAGHANKEIAQRLEVSPNTVKTHVARVFEKLGAKNRTDAVNKARELGIVP